MKDMMIVINGSGVLDELNRKNQFARGNWVRDCQSIRASYKQKTSRMSKGDKEYEYTKWYRETATGGLKCVGKDEPDWKKILPKEPETRTITAKAYRGQLILEQKEYEANIGLFLEYLVFRLEDCKNLLHPLYKNPEKALKGDSVRVYGAGSARSSWKPGQTNVPIIPGDSCLGDGNCDECEHSDECPVDIEQE